MAVMNGVENGVQLPDPTIDLHWDDFQGMADSSQLACGYADNVLKDRLLHFSTRRQKNILIGYA